ncbi:DUF1990 domain-containing protein [Gimesia sp.]|uniref:DUF1990 family protein n=1 Tax=Gimesia sp. TaxID=2024833 RepID=UPI000C5C04A4|nr:DUF1990 domain-containing protein [Gimesia sp.]MAX39777.1 DUF1990 domain-containing protein [Gimesia sp.]|tara:strand:+ start:42462 stop:43079 length:618 start_codon:yes stop_codon:yes gene_type:complete
MVFEIEGIDGMFLLQQPTAKQIDEFIAIQAQQELSYASRGATHTQTPPDGFQVDHNRICLGQGRVLYEQAKRALQDWQHFRLNWVSLHRQAAVPESGQTVAILAHALGLWILNACQVVYVLEETEPVQRYAFAYGTLPEHAECGEERFQVEWQADDDSVWYDLYAFSRPQQLLSKITYPYVRHKQKQFARDSLQAMQRAVAIHEK